MAEQILKALKESRRVLRRAAQTGLTPVGKYDVLPPPAPGKGSPVRELKWRGIEFAEIDHVRQSPRPLGIEALLKNHWALDSLRVALIAGASQMLTLEARGPYLPEKHGEGGNWYATTLKPVGQREYLFTTAEKLREALKTKGYGLHISDDEHASDKQHVELTQKGRKIGSMLLHRVAGRRFLVKVSVDGREHFEPIIKALLYKGKTFTKVLGEQNKDGK